MTHQLSPRRLALIVTTLLATGLAGWGIAPAATAPAPAHAWSTGGHASTAATTTVSAHLTPRAAVNLGNTPTVHGQVLDSGSPVAGVTVQLASDRFPFGAFGNGPQSQTDAQGLYSFTVSPTLNTRYRVTVPGATSATVTAVVVPQQGAWSAQAPSNVVTVHVKIHYPPSVREAGHPVYWYLALNGSRTALFKTTTKIGAPFKPGWSRISAHLHTGLPAGTPYRYEFFYLTRDLPHQGLGITPCQSTLKGDRFPLGHTSCRRPASFRIPAWS
jgi:hypothetical protein